MGGEEALHRGAGAGPGLAYEERLRGERLHRHTPPPRQRVLRGGDDHQGMPGKAEGAGLEIARRGSHQGQVHSISHQQLEDRFPVVHGQLQLDARMLAGKERQELGREVLGGADHADRDPPGL